jgi:hypothetical protein
MRKFIRSSSENKIATDKAEIEYYKQELAKELGDNFTSDLKEQFVADSAEIQREGEDLFDFAQNFLDIEKRKAELLQLHPTINPIDKLSIKRHFEDRVIAQESAFSRKSAKPSGVSTGYVATKQTDPTGLPFMIKTVDKSDNPNRNENDDAFFFVNEFIAAPLYKRTLYDRTPVIEGVVAAKADKIAFRSKFLHGFKTISEFTGSTLSCFTGTQKIEELQEVDGAEKVFAAILVWGEGDAHAGNLGVMPIQDEEGKFKSWCFRRSNVQQRRRGP